MNWDGWVRVKERNEKRQKNDKIKRAEKRFSKSRKNKSIK
jgi:hypothetical protein